MLNERLDQELVEFDRNRMRVSASRVKRVNRAWIKLTKDSCGDGMHHFLPTSMVDHVDSHVHLNKNSVEAMAGWKSDAASCGSCG